MILKLKSYKINVHKLYKIQRTRINLALTSISGFDNKRERIFTLPFEIASNIGLL